MLLRRVSADYLNPFLNEDKSLDLSVGYNLISKVQITIFVSKSFCG